MTIQQWLFSVKGRLGRRDFWVWMMIWLCAMALLFMLAAKALIAVQTASFILVCLLWPTAVVVMKRLHDRGRTGAWALLLILMWMLMAGHWDRLPGIGQWLAGIVAPGVIMVLMLLELGAFAGTQGENKYGKSTMLVKYRSTHQ